jgi:hypothetical protein
MLFRFPRVARSNHWIPSSVIALLLVTRTEPRAEGRFEVRSMPTTPRAVVSAVVDTVHGVLYTYGGGHEWNLGTPGTFSYGEELWAFDLETGTARLVHTTGTAPSTTTLGTMLFDAEHDQLVFLGERHAMGGTVLGIWFLSLSTSHWTVAPPGNANTSEAGGIALDAARDRLIQWYPDPAVGVWALPLAGGGGWQPIATSGASPPRLSTRMGVLDPVRDRLVIAPEDATVTNTMYALTLGDPPTWSPISVTGASPTSRRGRAYWDARHDQLVHVGEWENWWREPSYGFTTDVVSVLTFPPAPATPLWQTMRPYDANEVDMPAHYGSGTAFDARTGRAWSFAGADIYERVGDYADLHRIAVDAPATWESVPLSPPTFLPRSAALDPTQRRMLVVSQQAEVHEVQIDGDGRGSSRPLDSTGAPPALSQCELDVVTDIAGDRLLLMGSRTTDPPLLTSMRCMGHRNGHRCS